MNKVDLGWGNSLAVREAFLSTCKTNPLFVDKKLLSGFDYPDHDGDPSLVSITADVIKRQLGLTYRHIFMTNGATGGCVIAMRAYKQRGYSYCHTRNAPYYVRYPRMIDAAGLMHVQEDHHHIDGESVVLLDLPSNPLGLMSNISKSTSPVILDGVYLNSIYMPPILVNHVPHDVLIGSYSKLTGLNGLRIGWIATNDDLLASRIRELVASEYCGLSMSDSLILKSTLEDFDWDVFELKARKSLDINRTVWSRLEKYFGGEPVKGIGMFYFAGMDQKAQELFARAGIEWTKGSATGTTDDFARFNLGQSNETIYKAVQLVLKADIAK